MGLLDDAIREHLSLQRRNGLSDQEIAVKEAEALGPARRGELEEPPPAAAGVVTAEREAPPEEAASASAEPELLEDELSSSEQVAPKDDPVEDPPPPAAGALAEEEDDHHDLDLADERLDIDMPAAQAQPPVDAQPVVAESGDEPPTPSDDVLEETPDFLEETPEHERL